MCDCEADAGNSCCPDRFAPYELLPNADRVPPDGASGQQPCPGHELHRAKLYLKRRCPDAGDSSNLYDHLSEVLNKVLTEQPKDPLASFEAFSRRILEEKLPPNYGSDVHSLLRDVYVPPPNYQDALVIVDLFEKSVKLDTNTSDDGSSSGKNQQSMKRVPDLYEKMFHLEKAGVALPKSELVCLSLSIAKLVETHNIEKVRFWGKIMGRERSYFIVEATLTPEELERRLKEFEENLTRTISSDEIESANKDTEVSSLLTEEAARVALAGPDPTAEVKSIEASLPPMPEVTWVPEPELPMERLGSGANKHVYYVCNSPGIDEWTELPPVTPRQIVVARQINRLFVGHLEAPIRSFPPYPGCEKNYLRAQIARISADTRVSPLGYYVRADGLRHDAPDSTSANGDDDDEEDSKVSEDRPEEEDVSSVGEAKPSGDPIDAELAENAEYAPLALRDLTDPRLQNWVHHRPEILPQGRVAWWDPSQSQSIGEQWQQEIAGERGDDEEHQRSSSRSSIDDDGSNSSADELSVGEPKVGKEIDDGGGESGRKRRAKREVGRGLLEPLSEDPVLEQFVTPWRIRISSEFQPELAVVYVASNGWPGACAYAANKKCGNIYIGWGQKFHPYNYSPPPMPPIESQYPITEDITEAGDPSFEEEEAYRLAHLPPEHDEEEEFEEGDTDNETSETSSENDN